MLKEDLMIGDWVFNTHNRQNEQVAEIRSGLVMLDYNDLYEYDDIEPIALTAEMLLANGWKKDRDVIGMQYVSNDRRIILHDDPRFLNSNEKWYVHIDSSSMSSIGSCEFTFVHELQHFLRQCKISKAFVLGKENPGNIEKAEAKTSLRDKVLKEWNNGNVVFAAVDGLHVCPLENFVKQPLDGILYDLNRSEAVVLAFLYDAKWVNDYALTKLLRYYYDQAQHGSSKAE